MPALPASESWQPTPCDGEDIYCLLYTSGTSGRPKGALLTAENWRAMIDAWAPLMELGPGDRFLQVTPLFHGIQIYVDIQGADELTQDVIAAKLTASGGAHKPTYYDFGPDQQFQLDFYHSGSG